MLASKDPGLTCREGILSCSQQSSRHSDLDINISVRGRHYKVLPYPAPEGSDREGTAGHRSRAHSNPGGGASSWSLNRSRSWDRKRSWSRSWIRSWIRSWSRSWSRSLTVWPAWPPHRQSWSPHCRTWPSSARSLWPLQPWHLCISGKLFPTSGTVTQI